MALQLQNFQTMVQNMVGSAQGACSKLLNLTVGSALRAIIEATASVALWLQYLILIVLQQTRLASSTGAACDSFGADFGFTRLPAAAATGSVTFSRFVAATSALIPVGAQVRTTGNTTSFAVVEDDTNPLWSAASNGYIVPIGTLGAPVAVQAAAPGSGSNVLANTITLIVGAISGVDTVNNATAIENGKDAETDAAFKARFANYLATLSKGTEGSIEYGISSLDPNLTSDIVEFTDPAGDYVPGSFTVYVDDGSGNPPTNTINNVSAVVNADRALGIRWAVQGPAELVATITATLTVGPNTVKANIIAAVEQYVASKINALPLGQPLPYSQVSAWIYAGANSVTNVTNLLVNGGTADIGGAPQQVVRAGTVTLS